MGTIEDVLERSETMLDWKYWLRGTWPKGDRETVFLRDAVLEAGKAIFRDQWAGDEFLAAVRLPPIPELPSKPLPPGEDDFAVGELVRRRAKQFAQGNASMEQRFLDDHLTRCRTAADDAYKHALAQYDRAVREEPVLRELHLVNAGRRERLQKVLDLIAQWGRGGELETKVRRVDTWDGRGNFFDPPEPRGIWNVEPVEKARFWDCRFDEPRHGKVYIFFTRESLDHCLASLSAHGVEIITDASGQIRSGAAGRPNSKHLYISELERRLNAGEAHPKLAEEARHLIEWLEQEHSHMPRPKDRAMQNSIRATFNNWRAIKPRA